jgi:hypothetical protein
LPVAGTALVRRQRFEQRISDPHREAALRLAEHNLRHQRLAAFEHAVSLGDAQRSGGALDLDANERAAYRGIYGADPVVIGRRKLDADAIETLEFSAALAQRKRVDLGPVLFTAEREARAVGLWRQRVAARAGGISD